MESINIHKSKTHLSSLIDKVTESDEAFVIAKAGRPIVKVVPIDSSEECSKPCPGFLQGKAVIPENFDSLGDSEINTDFYS